MRIGLDIMGGDFAPAATVNGAILARRELPAQIKLPDSRDGELQQPESQLY